MLSHTHTQRNEFLIYFVLLALSVETRQNLQTLARLARFQSEVTVLRNGQYIKISSDDLVPGDILDIQTNVCACV